MMEYYDNYYEEDVGDEVVVHLDYLEPEPSLFQQSSRYDRPSLRREYAPVMRTSKQRLSRPNIGNYNHNHNSNNNGRGASNRLQDGDHVNMEDYNDYHDYRDDDDDGDMYGRMTERVNIQEQRYGAESIRTMASGSTRSSNESRGRMDRGGGGGHMNMRNNNNTNNNNNNMRDMRGAGLGLGPVIATGRANPGNNRGSGRSVVSRLSTTSQQKKGISKMDLTRPDADSSFELFATLLIQHLDPKINDDMNMYTLEAGDMAYFEAIIPEALRNPFVEAVRVRMGRLPEELMDGESESDLDKITRKCDAFGLGQSAENNFLLGGGEKKVGKTIIRLVEEESFESQQLAEQNGMSEAEALAQVEAAFNNRPQEMVMQTQPNINNSQVHADGGDQEEEISSKRQFVAQSGGAGVDYNNLQQKEQEVPTKHQVEIELAEMRNPSATGSAQREANLSGREEGAVLHKEQVFHEVVENFAPVQQAVFDLTVKRIEEKKAHAREKRMKKSSRKMSNLTSAISVNTSPSNLDMTVAAFEHEWRDGLWDVYTHGVCHPLLILSFLGPIFALGQVMTRLKLNWIGVPSNEAGTNAIFSKIGTLVAFWATVNVGALSSYAYAFMHPYLEVVVMAVVMTNLWFYSFCVFVTGNTRQYLREIYNIQDGAGSDYLLAAIYMPFSIAQMGRHTADYNSLQGRLCTATGLAREADYSFISNINTMDSFGTYRSFNDDATSFGGSVNTRKSMRSYKSAKSRRSKRSYKSRMSAVGEDDEDDSTSFSGTSYTGSAASLV